jgi:beta-glucosidase
MRRRETLALAALSLASPGSLAWRGMAGSAGSGEEPLHFGPDFAFGVASSAYQIEGAVRTDGRGSGIWDDFCHHSPRMAAGANADIACDHYHRMAADVALIADAGIRHYRFSVSWPRLFPGGGTVANHPGFSFYDRLLDALLARGIEPWLCLYHWDLPSELEAAGGWTNRDTAFRFAAFAASVATYFASRVSRWFILNEAAVQACFGYGFGAHAPGRTGRESWFAALHHLNLGQGLAIAALRTCRPAAKIGTIACCEPVRPSSRRPEDVAAAARFDAAWNGAVLEPLFHGIYPALVRDAVARYCRPDDLTLIRQRIDFLGVNYYSRLHIQHDPSSPIEANFGPVTDVARFTIMGWPIEPDGLLEILLELKAALGDPEIIVTENGYSTTRSGLLETDLNDVGRVEYLRAHLRFLKKAVELGVRVNGYFVWALLDSFEWNDGMRWHFGLVDVDFTTLKRSPKQSYLWYSRHVRAQRL